MSVTWRDFICQVVLLSGHLDSWDVGQGAMDDGGGAMISWEALSLIKDLGSTKHCVTHAHHAFADTSRWRKTQIIVDEKQRPSANSLSLHFQPAFHTDSSSLGFNSRACSAICSSFTLLYCGHLRLTLCFMASFKSITC